MKNSLPTRSQVHAGLTVAALGVVYGDIGTSPLYTLKTCFTSAHVGVTPENVLGILSLLVWALIVVVCVKYMAIVMRVDHDGEGGILALLALLLARPEKGIPPKGHLVRGRRRRRGGDALRRRGDHAGDLGDLGGRRDRGRDLGRAALDRADLARR